MTAARPAFEQESFTLITQAVAAFNKAAGMSRAKLALSATLEETPHRAYEEGNNWGSSHIEEWGKIDIALTRDGEAALPLMSYRLKSSHGSREISIINVMEGAYGVYGTWPLNTQEGYKAVLSHIGIAMRAALEKNTLPPEMSGQILGAFEGVTADLLTRNNQRLVIDGALSKLQHAFPDMTVQQIIRGPLARHIRSLTPKG